MTKDEAFKKLDSFRDLKQGWNTYNANPIDERAIHGAMFLINICPEILNHLEPTPTANGGICFEGSDVEYMVEIDPSGLDVGLSLEGLPLTIAARIIKEHGLHAR